jgi:hypothetical protein
MDAAQRPSSKTMRTILHIGMPKTGTTALQSALHFGRERLAATGILYPKLAILPHAHHLLGPLIQKEGQYWGQVKAQAGSRPGEVIAAAERALEDIEHTVRNTGPECLVLSSEVFFGDSDTGKLAAFGERLRRFSGTVTVVAYVREPASYYDSILIERSKRGLRLRAPEAIQYRAPIEACEAAMQARVIVRPFLRTSLDEGDLIADFCRHALGRSASELEVASRQSNVSLHPETSELFQAYNARRHGRSRWLVSAEERRVHARLAAVQAHVGIDTRTRLNPKIGRHIEAVSSDLWWLRERFGIVFPKVDYATAGRGPAETPPKVETLRDAFAFDAVYQARLLEEIGRSDPDIANVLNSSESAWSSLKESASPRK